MMPRMHNDVVETDGIVQSRAVPSSVVGQPGVKHLVQLPQPVGQSVLHTRPNRADELKEAYVKLAGFSTLLLIAASAWTVI